VILRLTLFHCVQRAYIERTKYRTHILFRIRTFDVHAGNAYLFAVMANDSALTKAAAAAAANYYVTQSRITL